MFNRFVLMNVALCPALLLTSFSSSGQQRKVDQEVSCVSPEGSVVNGEGLPLRFEMRNLGPDPRYKNDTNLYWLHVIEENGDTWLMYQGSLAGKEEGEVGLGEIRAYADNWGIKFIYPERNKPYTIDFCVTVTTFKVGDDGDTIQYFSHYDPNLSNNTCCKKVTILPKSSSIAQDTRQNEEGIWVYPNPVRDRLHILTSAGFSEKGLTVSITDISGRLLQTRQYVRGTPGDDTWSVDVAGLTAGIYQVHLRSAKGVVSRKIVIDR